MYIQSNNPFQHSNTKLFISTSQDLRVFPNLSALPISCNSIWCAKLKDFFGTAYLMFQIQW